jgi:hypothetical protein
VERNHRHTTRSRPVQHRSRQRHRLPTSEFRILKNIWVHHPDQHNVLARKIDAFFSTGRKEIILHYDRAANQRTSEYRKFYSLYLEDGVNDTDAILLKKELTALGWAVRLMSVNLAVATPGRIIVSKARVGKLKEWLSQ